MSLTKTRPEKSDAMTFVVGDLRNLLGEKAQAQGLNIAEALSCGAQLFASLLAGAYDTNKNQEIVLSALPDLVRAYIPQWERIYADAKKQQPEKFASR